MRKEYRRISIITAAFALALPALAADMTAVRVSVPFEFTAGPATLPAGEYLISQQADAHVMTIAGKGGDAILITRPAEGTSLARNSTLTFARTGKGAMLTEIRMAGSGSDVLNRK